MVAVGIDIGISKMYKAIEPKKAHNLMQEGSLTIVDIRDLTSFQMGHLENARHVTGDDVEEFIHSSDLNQPLLVYCYHGNASQSAAAYFKERGFQHVYHLAGGFEAWRLDGFPTNSN